MRFGMALPWLDWQCPASHEHDAKARVRQRSNHCTMDVHLPPIPSTIALPIVLRMRMRAGVVVHSIVVKTVATWPRGQSCNSVEGA